MICTHCKTREVDANMAAGPIDCCTECKLDMYFIGRLVTTIDEKAAHVIMGAFNLTDSEGVTYIADGVTDDPEKAEVEVVRLLHRIHPDVVTHERYASMPSVKEVLK